MAQLMARIPTTMENPHDVSSRPSAKKFSNLVELFEKSVKAYEGRELFGVKKGDVWTWTTYGTIGAEVTDARGGLSALGVGSGDRVAIVSNNRPEWAVLAYATYGLGAAYVPMYEAQHAEEWEFIAADCGAKVLVVATRAIYEKVKSFPERLPELKHIVCLEGDDDISYSRLLTSGKKSPAPSVQPDPKDIAGLIYTSGTTGKPKGVLLSHDNLASNVSAVHDFFPMTADDRSLSFLPWAHSFGQTCELHCLVSMGASIALNTAVDKLLAELAEVQPTLLFSVPRIFNRIYDGVGKQMSEKPAFIRSLFHSALKIAAAERDGKPVGMVDSLKLALARKLIFGKVVARFGGRLRYAFSGGAALSKDVAEFIDGLGVMVYEGYGLTETSPIATANSPKGRRIGSVGRAIPGVSIVIDKAATGDEKNGEILVYGHNVMQGYHNRPDENEKVLMPDGGFRTGDMGHLDADGYLWITGRIKEQYKLENGKYVTPVPMEEALKLSPFITNVMVYGANHPHNVALIVPDPDATQKYAAEQGINGTLDELVANPRIKKKIEEEVEKYSKTFKGFDRIKSFALIAEDFTVQNDMLTPSLKLKRRNVMAKWGELLEKLYALRPTAARRGYPPRRAFRVS